ncbi:MAG TPA: cysteine/glutathione ABC transporter permease/ATP-binding protein CydD [Pseudomonadales bacterium]|nr:cysteine/glutathione ABC transporter permease/ATP-binding protein CydD [Pseudomonadales bacterium]
MDKLLEQSLTHWLKGQKSACGLFLKLSVLFGALTGCALVVQAYLIASILHGVIMLEQNAAHFEGEFIALVGLILLRAALAYGRERVSFEAGRRLRTSIRAAVLNKLETLGPAFIRGKPAGSWASIVLEQVEDLQDFYARYLPQMSLAGFIPLIILAAVFPINWAAGVILLATAPLIPMFMMLVGMGAADANRKNFSALARLSGHFMDRLKGLSTLKLFYRGESELKVIEKASEEFRSRTMAVLRMAFLSSAVLEFFAAVSIAVLAVYFGFSYLGHLDFGHYGVAISLFTGLFVLILAPEFYQPLRDLGTHYHAKAQAIGAAEALMELLEYPESHHCAANNSTDASTDTVVNKELDQPFCFDSAQGISIEARSLCVLSHQGAVLLGPVSFSVARGEHVAVVGPSGAGKTSLLNALLGFLPYEGQLLINGVELRNINLELWRQRLAWLGQEPQLFHGTVRDNIALAQPSMSDDAIYALLASAHIDDFVRAQPLGLDHGVGEHSAGLSVGQTQRLALARALVQDATLFLLDEPTASLDSQSEAYILDALHQAMAGQSCLMVTHKLEELDLMDKIMVIDNGAIVQQGHFNVLATQEGLFQQLLQQGAPSLVDLTLDEDDASAFVTGAH